MKLTVNHVSLAIGLSLALSSGTAFALPILNDGDAGAATYVGRQVADPLQFGTGNRGLQSLEAMPIEASSLNRPTKRFDDLKRSTSQAPVKPPVWVPMDPEREELGPGEAPRPKKPRHVKKKSAYPKKSKKKASGKSPKKSAKHSRVERKLAQHQRALYDQEKFASKSSKAGKPTESGHKGPNKNTHSKVTPPFKSSRKGADSSHSKDHKGPPGKGDHNPPHQFSSDPFASNKIQQRDEQDDQMEKASQVPEQGEPKGDEVDQSKGPQPTLASMLLPIKRSLWSSPSDDLIFYDRDIDKADQDARDDDDGNVFWDRDIDGFASRDIGLPEEELEDARNLLTDLDTFEEARDDMSAELFAAHPPTIGKRDDIDEAVKSAWARAAVDADITARDWRLAAQKAIDCSVDPAGCAFKYGMSYTGLQPSEGQKATFDRLRAATQKVRDCSTDPTGCAMNHGLKSVGLEPPPGRRSAADEQLAV